MILAQKAAKRWLRRRNEAASTIQQAARNFLLLRRQKKFEQGIIKAQVQLWLEEVDQSDEPDCKVFIIRLFGGCKRRVTDQQPLIGFALLLMSSCSPSRLCGEDIAPADSMIMSGL